MLQGYKVTRTDGKSCTASGKYQRLYLPHTIIEAEPGTVGLMLFSTERRAREFGDSIMLHFMIYEVEYKEIDEEFHPSICSHTNVEALNMFYQHKLIPRPFLVSPPEGTVFAKKIYVKEVVYKNYSSLCREYKQIFTPSGRVLL